MVVTVFLALPGKTRRVAIDRLNAYIGRDCVGQ